MNIIFCYPYSLLGVKIIQARKPHLGSGVVVLEKCRSLLPGVPPLALAATATAVTLMSFNRGIEIQGFCLFFNILLSLVFTEASHEFTD